MREMMSKVASVQAGKERSISGLGIKKCSITSTAAFRIWPHIYLTLRFGMQPCNPQKNCQARCVAAAAETRVGMVEGGIQIFHVLHIFRNIVKISARWNTGISLSLSL
jgi:hypothetical protein